MTYCPININGDHRGHSQRSDTHVVNQWSWFTRHPMFRVSRVNMKPWFPLISCFSFKHIQWNDEFANFVRKKQKLWWITLLRGSCETSDKPQDGIFLWLFVWLCFWLFQAAEQILPHWVPNEHMFSNVFPRFFPSPGASNHRKPGFSFVWELSTWVVGFMEILGPRVLAETELPTSTQNDIERQWPCQKGLNKINQPPSAPGYFQIKRDGWKTIKTLKRQ